MARFWRCRFMARLWRSHVFELHSRALYVNRRGATLECTLHRLQEALPISSLGTKGRDILFSLGFGVLGAAALIHVAVITEDEANNSTRISARCLRSKRRFFA